MPTALQIVHQQLPYGHPSEATSFDNWGNVIWQLSQRRQLSLFASKGLSMLLCNSPWSCPHVQCTLHQWAYASVCILYECMRIQWAHLWHGYGLVLIKNIVCALWTEPIQIDAHLNCKSMHISVEKASFLIRDTSEMISSAIIWSSLSRSCTVLLLLKCCSFKGPCNLLPRFGRFGTSRLDVWCTDNWRCKCRQKPSWLGWMVCALPCRL